MSDMIDVRPAARRSVRSGVNVQVGMQLGTRPWELCRKGEVGWSNTLFPHHKRGKKGMGEKYSRSVTSRQVDKRSESETCAAVMKSLETNGEGKEERMSRCARPRICIGGW